MSSKKSQPGNSVKPALDNVRLQQLTHEFMRDYGTSEITLNEFCSRTIQRLPTDIQVELERNISKKKNFENKMKIIFQRHDTNHDGKVAVSEVESMLKEIFEKRHEQLVHISDVEIKQAANHFMEQYDKNKDGKITFDEFHSRTVHTLPEHIKVELEKHIDINEQLNEQIKQVFNAHDTDKDGVIQLTEIESLLKQIFHSSNPKS